MNTTNKKIIIGGSFDPITKAHVHLIQELSNRFNTVIVVPCKVSPFKEGTSEDANLRLSLLKLALSGINVDISTFELDSNQPNYSYLTVKHFYDGSPLYFAIGSEMLIELDRWFNVIELSKMATFYVIPRPGFNVDYKLLNELKDKGISIEIADFIGESGSSSEVKVAIASGEYNLYLTNEVALSVKEQNLYTDYCYVNELYKKYHMKEKRIKHSFSTALCGINLAKRLKVDINKAITALLLHDIGKYITIEDAEALGVRLRDEVYEMPEKIRHAEIGAEILKQIEKITDNDIIEAVRWHTTGKENMTNLEIVVYLADYIEPLRDFPGVDYIRKETEKSVLDGLYAGLENALDYVNMEKIYKTTISAYNYYKELLKK